MLMYHLEHETAESLVKISASFSFCQINHHIVIPLNSKRMSVVIIFWWLELRMTMLTWSKPFMFIPNEVPETTKEVSFNENFLIKSYLVSFVRDFWLAPRCLTTDPESRSSDDTNVIRNHEEVGNQCTFAVFFVVLFGFEFYFESVVYGIQDFRFLKIVIYCCRLQKIRGSNYMFS